ncbi:MAG: adenylate kinase [Alphaproteobacteria bacterium GM202ARS2]|nr:adenylate kinase [Alphaproteobacteria bacterium GM202ARS2]
MNLLLIGPPGAGKGTNAQYINQHYHLHWLASGDLLREEVAKASVLGKKVKEILEQGKLVDDETMIQLIRHPIHGLVREQRGFILDGFPRTTQQAQALQTMLREEGTSIDKIIVLDVDDDVLVKRISHRFSCTHCGAVYNMLYHPPKHADTCDRCGRKNTLKQRSDDKEEVVRERLHLYHQQADPLLVYYQEQACSISHIDAMADIAAVQKRIDSVLAS